MLAGDIEARALAVIGAGLAPPPDLPPSAWVERFRVLDPSAALPGKFSFNTTPYFRAPLDDLSTTSGIKTVVVCAGAQLGKTELILSAVCYWIANDPKPIMCVWPTVDVAKRVVVSRLEPALASVPEVKVRIIPERSRERGNTTFHKKLIGGGDLVIVGANAPAPLRSSPINFALLDEVSAFPGSTEEGDVLDLVAARQYTYPHTCKTLLTSTPLDEGACRITRAYLETNQQKYFIPCLQCGHMFVITFADIKWPTGEPDKAALVCPACGSVHDDFDKPEQLRRGAWRPTAEGGDPTMAGYHVSGLYSPWLRYGAIATHHRKVRKDPPRLRVFVNTILAETWRDESGEKIEPATIAERVERGDWTAALPPGVAILTASVDTQDNRLELEIVGWGKDEESWSIEYRQIFGDTSDKAVWQELDELLLRTFQHSLAVPDMGISAVCIDTQGHSSAMAYSYCRDKFERRIWGIKGSNSAGKPPIWPRKPAKQKNGKFNPTFVGVNTAKEVIYSRMKITEPGPGYMHFPADRADTYFAQLTAERMISVWSKGRETKVWDKGSRRNEAFDLKVYNLAALNSLYAMRFDLNAAAAALAEIPARSADRPVIAAPPPVRRVTRSSWLES